MKEIIPVLALCLLMVCAVSSTDCSAGESYQNCGSKCQEQYDNRHTTSSCNDECTEGCFCSSGTFRCSNNECSSSCD
ncbi:hypothetical protein B4U80_14927 [Leptotrombidium deliense]|uniref:TIL domain-containing protein n=1 Tax=Leptotrombidium deliense TaxID=299467 RepID=A0A443S097_9ACAR|nr:hypothetical protein B4U80_14927 [Leptotrombidium deliense]